MLTEVLPSVVSATVVGLGVGWLATQKALAEYNIRIERVESGLARLEEQRARREEADSKNTERLVRVETKMDVLIGLRGLSESDR